MLRVPVRFTRLTDEEINASVSEVMRLVQELEHAAAEAANADTSFRFSPTSESSRFRHLARVRCAEIRSEIELAARSLLINHNAKIPGVALVPPPNDHESKSLR